MDVYTSNGGAEEMFRAWTVLAHRMPTSADVIALREFLAERFRGGAGLKAIHFDNLDPRISSPARLSLLAQVVAAFGRELTRETPDPELTTIWWDRDLRLMWIAWMLDLLEIIVDAGANDGATLFDWQRKLPPADQKEVAVRRLRNRHHVLKRRDASPEQLLAVSDEVLKLLLELPVSEQRAKDLSLERQVRAEMLLSLGDRSAAIEEVRQAIEVEPEKEMRDILEEYIDVL